jgi:hypothetical protein
MDEIHLNPFRVLKPFLLFPDKPEGLKDLEEFKHEHPKSGEENIVIVTSHGPALLKLLEYSEDDDDEDLL